MQKNAPTAACMPVSRTRGLDGPPTISRAAIQRPAIPASMNRSSVASSGNAIGRAIAWNGTSSSITRKAASVQGSARFVWGHASVAASADRMAESVEAAAPRSGASGG